MAQRRKRFDHRINVTGAERDYLHAERLRAMHDCPDLSFQRWRRGEGNFWAWQPRLDVIGRDRDGSLLARIVICKRDAETRYVRKLRVHHSKGSTGARELQLRRVASTG